MKMHDGLHCGLPVFQFGLYDDDLLTVNSKRPPSGKQQRQADAARSRPKSGSKKTMCQLITFTTLYIELQKTFTQFKFLNYCSYKIFKLMTNVFIFFDHVKYNTTYFFSV